MNISVFGDSQSWQEHYSGEPLLVGNYNEFLEEMQLAASELTEELAGVKGALSARKRKAASSSSAK